MAIHTGLKLILQNNESVGMINDSIRQTQIIDISIKENNVNKY